jgi:hypothetical protein
MGLTPFPKMKEGLHGHLYDSNEEVERIVRTWMKKEIVEFFHDGFQKLVHRWKNCVENGGDYVEKEIQVIKELILRIIIVFNLLKYPY